MPSCKQCGQAVIFRQKGKQRVKLDPNGKPHRCPKKAKKATDGRTGD